MRRPADPAGSRSSAAQRIVGPLPWVVIIVGLIIDEIVRLIGYNRTEQILLTTLTVFFPVLLLNLIVTAIHQPARRPALHLLIAVITMWALGTAWVNSVEEAPEFPAPSEWLFLISYLGMVGYLLRDVDRRQQRPGRSWIDVTIICGGTACFGSLLLVMPITIASGNEGVPLLLALIYPLADAVLALIVLGQWLRQLRTDGKKSLMLGTAFVLLAYADSVFALRESASNYAFGLLSYVAWGVAFALLVTAAARPEQSEIRSVPRETGAAVLVTAGIVAVAVLIVRPDNSLPYYTLPPAVLTMAAVAARMALALRDANRANEAFALSETDDLTKLPNRRAVRAWLADGLTRRRPLGLMLLDLDGFKEINDSLGHRAGDTVLRLVAVRLREAVEPHVRVARLGGDEFAVIMHTADEIVLMETARAVLAELAKPIVVENIELSPAGSIGVTTARVDDADGGEVLRRADVAMYQAKSSGLGVAIYDVQLDEFSRSRLLLAEELRRAISDGQIEIWYQPQLDATTMKVSGLEALMRWRHPTQGVLSPVTFLPAARRAGLMGRLSEVVARRAVQDMRDRHLAGIDVTVAINCAPPELLGPTFITHLHECIEEFGIPADCLVLEITEDSFLTDPLRTREVLLDLRSRGVQVSIDDYGTGFSSLTYLRNLPVQELKIDRTLIAQVATDDRSRMIVASTIQLAHALGLRIVAEGVEGPADLASLVDMGIDTIQGYHLARPMPSSLIDGWILAWNAAEHPTRASSDEESS